MRARLQLATAAGQSEGWMHAAAERAARCDEAIAHATASGLASAEACDLSGFRAQAEQACGTAKGSRPACLWKEVIEEASSVPDIVRLEAAFGVLDDYRQSAPSEECPPLTPVRAPAAFASAR